MIKTVLKDKLELDINGIERCHRMRRVRVGKIRPVILRVVDFPVKLSILRNARQLKDSGISIREDVSLRIQSTRKMLWDPCATERAARRKVFLQYDNLFIDGVCYTWNHETGDKIPLHSRHSI